VGVVSAYSSVYYGQQHWIILIVSRENTRIRGGLVLKAVVVGYFSIRRLIEHCGPALALEVGI
jgi:hypothetical protein